uniref:Uncharacterized protein n=1 Tax=Anopheles melas TaxID=34690 RepID=A0A182THP2_9DIPT
MAVTSTLLVLLFFTATISSGLAVTRCKPHVDIFEAVQSLLATSASKYGTQHSSEYSVTHNTLLRILERHQTELGRLTTAARSMETLTNDKLQQYGLSRKLTFDGRAANDIDTLRDIFHRLDEENDDVLRVLENNRQEYVEQQQELDDLVKQLEHQHHGNIALEKNIKQRNETLTKTLATNVKLERIVKERGLQ